jgi:signal peptidase I
LVQPELHPSDEGREVDGNPREPHADAPAARVPEAVTERSAEAGAVHTEPDDRSAKAFALQSESESRDESLPLQTGPLEPDALALHSEIDGAGRLRAEGADSERAEAGRLQPSEIDATPSRSTNVRLAQVKEELVAWLKTLVSAAVYAVLIVTFLFQVARVEGLSMAPTLEDQDRLIVNKLVYRIGEPRRGDIVMLYYPLNPEKSFVKRVIAEEGDTVRIVDGRVYVNDIPLKDDYVPNEYRSHDDWGPQVIPDGYYFVMGDHRNNSSDSRHWGMVPKKYIIGKVQLRWWPVPTARVF